LLVFSALAPNLSQLANADSAPKKLKPPTPMPYLRHGLGTDDHPAYGVKVRIRRASDKKPKWELYSDHHGEFALRVAAARMTTSWRRRQRRENSGWQPVHLIEEVPVHVEYDERVILDYI